jgi:hypothetical protein
MNALKAYDVPSIAALLTVLLDKTFYSPNGQNYIHLEFAYNFSLDNKENNKLNFELSYFAKEDGKRSNPYDLKASVN